MTLLNKDMTLCISLSARPSNNGTRFHNHLYEALGLNWIYKAFAPTDLGQAIAGVRGLGIRGCAISMPYKEEVIALVDRMDPSASAIDSVNTIVNDGGVLTAHNTDYSAIAQLIESNALDSAASVLLRGSGGMAKATAAAFRDAGFARVTIVARNEENGRALASLYDFGWAAEVGDATADILVNVTPIGMAGGAEEHALAFSKEAIAAASVVFDVVALPAETPLIAAGRAAGKTVITGAEVATLQALEQFVLYTGIRPSAEQVQEAEEFMRAGTP
ncbi:MULTISPECIES: shikimate 5-dehydrogenase [unclassified Microbacterium]|uniref:shikimate 5-dehydrogenase n=1 Tax=unclassified Microbacterium TaxID=2609290 RepID=UPI000CFBCDA1|nr:MULTISPECIES: shikimate 5-dehydrogenase [unclassified Microbacterium]PQZ55714.1 shikimate 5-dehydrogenase [Microbacterium sp. MYb43]PQZ81046.1 shikimate 5-dehydrogenase [Microbacterium sp. MYb40]PRB20878.1 shikimate 5-dehydrogenase [Microbacterium sp. MYb54]PRB31939.1 shikimate 5-dehydrogenase [Microbacterium sp. MYb50]PRB64446.1 shikimate 5-dehydrogenase [Microbacterium sp. MYb24]